MRFTRMNNVHIEIEPQALFKDVLQTVLKDSGQPLDKTAPNKFRNRKFPTVYIEAHIELAKVCSIGVWNEKRMCTHLLHSSKIALELAHLAHSSKSRSDLGTIL